MTSADKEIIFRDFCHMSCDFYTITAPQNISTFLMSHGKRLSSRWREGNFNGILMSDGSGQYAVIDCLHDKADRSLQSPQYSTLFISFLTRMYSNFFTLKISTYSHEFFRRRTCFLIHMDFKIFPQASFHKLSV